MTENMTMAAPTKTKSMKIDLTIPVSVEYGKNEKGAYTAKIIGLKGKDGEDLYYTNKDKSILQAKVEKSAATAAKYAYANYIQSNAGYACTGSST